MNFNIAVQGRKVMSEQEKIENSYKKMYQGMINKDRNILMEILDDSFVLVHMTGMRQTKTAFIRAVEDGTLNYYSAVHQHIRVNLRGNEAELTGQSMVNAAVFGGGRHIWKLQLQLTLGQRAGVWKIMEVKASTY